MFDCKPSRWGPPRLFRFLLERAAPLLLLFSAACGGEDALPAIVGDWLQCTTLDCGVLGVKGSRFGADGSLVHLYPEKQVLDASNGYCHTTNPELLRSYRYDGEKALETFEKSGAVRRYVFIIEGDLARVTIQNSTYHMKRVDPARDRGSCSERTPWVCPVGAGGGTTQKCQVQWTCDNGTFEVLCQQQSGAYQCGCLNGGAAQKTFSSSGLCTQLDLSALINEANKGCGWKLSLPM